MKESLRYRCMISKLNDRAPNNSLENRRENAAVSQLQRYHFDLKSSILTFNDIIEVVVSPIYRKATRVSFLYVR